MRSICFFVLFIHFSSSQDITLMTTNNEIFNLIVRLLFVAFQGPTNFLHCIQYHSVTVLYHNSLFLLYLLFPATNRMQFITPYSIVLKKRVYCFQYTLVILLYFFKSFFQQPFFGRLHTDFFFRFCFSYKNTVNFFCCIKIQFSIVYNYSFNSLFLLIIY